jgi:hypothetical protein
MAPHPIFRRERLTERERFVVGPLAPLHVGAAY